MTNITTPPKNTATPRNFILASYLVAAAFILLVAHGFLIGLSVGDPMFPLFAGAWILVFILIILLRMGLSWSKYLLGFFAVLTIITLPDMLDVRTLFTLTGLQTLLGFIRPVLVVWATVLVFKR